MIHCRYYRYVRVAAYVVSSWECAAYCLRSLVSVIDTPAGSDMILSVLFSCCMLVFPAPLLALPAPEHLYKKLERFSNLDTKHSSDTKRQGYQLDTITKKSVQQS